MMIHAMRRRIHVEEEDTPLFTLSDDSSNDEEDTCHMRRIHVI
jgi:hypothetical protein